MPYKTHKLNSQNHSHIINRQDSVTGDTIKANDEVVFCSACQSVFLVESWEYMNQKHCNQIETLGFVPTPLPILKAKKKIKKRDKNDKLIFGFESNISAIVKLLPSLLPSLFIPLITTVGRSNDYSIFSILLCFLIPFITALGLQIKKIREFLKLDKKTVRIFGEGIEVQNDGFYTYSEIEKIEYVKKNSIDNSKNKSPYLIIYLKNKETIKQELPSKSHKNMRPFLHALSSWVANFTQVHCYIEDKKELETIKKIERNYIGNILFLDNV